jgi:hypothetical protein
MQPPLVVTNITLQSIQPVPAGSQTHFLAIFPKEFQARTAQRKVIIITVITPQSLQGGLRLTVANGVAGTTVDITCGESLTGTTVGTFWG